MSSRYLSAVPILVCALSFSAPAISRAQNATRQAPLAASAPTVVPSLIPFAGVAQSREGKALQEDTAMNFLIFKDEKGGEPLWAETQTVAVDGTGKYQVQLGASSPSGLPIDVFASGEARWVEVQIAGQASQPRVLLASVPYAMKAAEAESLAGLPAAEYVTQAQLAGMAKDLAARAAAQITPLTSGPVSGQGTTGTIPIWSGTNTLANSSMTQVGVDIGINNTAPASTLDVGGTATVRGEFLLPPIGTATATTSYGSQLLQVAGSAWSAATNAAVAQNFNWQVFPQGNDTSNPSAYMVYRYQSGTSPAIDLMFLSPSSMLANVPMIMQSPTKATASAGANSPVVELTGSSYTSSGSAPVVENFAWQMQATGNDTATPSGEMALLYSQNSAALAATGFSINSNGTINFSSKQTFPIQGTGGGTITGITTTSPLTGSGTSGSVALGLNTSALETTLNGVYPQLTTANTYTLGATFGGPISAASATSGVSAVTATGTIGANGITATSDTGNAVTVSSGSDAYATIYALNTAPVNSHIPVALNGTSTGTESVGAYGVGTLGGVWGNSNSGFGVWGSTGASQQIPTLLSTGVLGNSVSPAPGNAGTVGFTSNGQSTSYAYEVARNGVSGVWGDTTGNPASSLDFSAGVMGTTDAYDGYGGVFIANSTVSDAVFAKNLSSGTGVFGESLGTGVANGRGTSGTGVQGFTPSPAEGASGVFGQAYQASGSYSAVEALGPVGFVAGVWGDAGEVNDGTGTYEAGVVGTGDDITAAVFQNNSPSGHPTVSAVNTASGGGSGTLFRTFIAATPDGTCGFGGAGDMTCTGQVKALASTGDGARKVETYSVQSPENWMEDFGSGELRNGVALVRIDPAYADTVTADASYHVFITPNGDSKGLYVISKTQTSFEVRESGGGTSSLSFDYRIVAKRRGYEAQRLTDVTERFNAERAQAMPERHAPVATSVRQHMTTPGQAEPAENVAPRRAPSPARPAPARPGAGAAIAQVHREPKKLP